jgi:ABC-type Zn uptake system ZnuABC Zn-binding protein ZnuA
MVDATDRFLKAERLLPDLLMEMRTDLAAKPLSREFVVLRKTWSYWAKGHELAYYEEEHADLESKLPNSGEPKPRPRDHLQQRQALHDD